MKIKITFLFLLSFVTVMSSTVPLFAEIVPDRHTHLGVALDRNPLPELFTKHLQIAPGQGLLIKNVYINSPADKSGLDKDDIIIAFEGAGIFGYQELVDQIQQAGAGTEVEIEVIHLGLRKTIKIKLEKLNRQDEPDETNWKYPFESEVYQMWRPGRIFRFSPGDEDWTQVPFKDVPEIKMDIKKFFQEKYFFQHTTDDEEFSVTIEGSPDDSSSTITLETRKNKERKTYVATIGEIEKLPEKYLPTVKKDVEEARETTSEKHRISGYYGDIEEAQREMMKAYKDMEEAQSEMHEMHEDLFKEFKVKIPKPEYFKRKFKSFDFDEKLQDMQEQMEELKKKMAELEESFKSRYTPSEEFPESSDTTDEEI